VQTARGLLARAQVRPVARAGDQQRRGLRRRAHRAVAELTEVVVAPAVQRAAAQAAAVERSGDDLAPVGRGADLHRREEVAGRAVAELTGITVAPARHAV